MRQIRSMSRFVPALALLALAACGRDRSATGPAALTSEPFFLTGSITEVGNSWGYRIEGTPGTAYRVNVAYFSVDAKTVIQHADGSGATAAELTVGRGATLWITGAIAESLPVQVGARLIVIR